MSRLLVVDSSLVIAHLKGATEATRFLEENADRDDLIAPALVAWELWKGATTAKRADAVRAILESMRVEPFMPAMAELAGRLHVEHRERGRERPAYDLLIAAHALFHDVPLATLDRDYDGVAGLRVLRVPVK